MQSSISRPRRLAARFVLFICLIYLLGLGTVSALLWNLADQWWPATALSFAPLKLLAMPLILLVPLALVFHRWSLLTLAAAGAVLAWPMLGLQIAWQGMSSDSQAPSLRVMTCNIHRTQLNAAEFRKVLESVRPDVVAMQDWTSVDQPKLFPPSNWNTCRNGELFLASRFPISQAQSISLAEPPPAKFEFRLGAAACYRLTTPMGEVNLINLHLSSPHSALDALKRFDPTAPQQLIYNSLCREMESATIQQFTETLDNPALIVGDFNTPTVSTLYRRHWNDFSNAFSTVGCGYGTTHISATSSVRIDHILYGPGWQARSCWTGPAVGSPHRPLVADMQPNRNLLMSGSTANAQR